MKEIYSEKDFSVRRFDSQNELRALTKPLFDTVYNQYSSFDTTSLRTDHNLNENKAGLYSLNLGLFHGDKIIGWSDGGQTHKNTYYMQNSAVLSEYRRKGLYSKLLDIVLAETKNEGFLEVTSNHNTMNQKIIMAKMKKGFFISGFEVSAKYGLTVQLTYCHCEKLKKMHEFRVGKRIDDSIKELYL